MKILSMRDFDRVIRYPMGSVVPSVVALIWV